VLVGRGGVAWVEKRGVGMRNKKRKEMAVQPVPFIQISEALSMRGRGEGIPFKGSRE
jgi:hypothetical protein